MLASLLRRRAERERELDEELAFHLEMAEAELRRTGLDAAEARRRARALFGSVEGVKEGCRAERPAAFLETLGQDLGWTLRSLRRSRGYVVAVVATLALAIGANSAVFSLVSGILLRPLPLAGGDRLVRVEATVPWLGDGGTLPFSIQEARDLAARTRTLDRLVEAHTMQFTRLGRAEPERVRTGVVSWDYFEVLGIAPLLGRTFLAGDEGEGSEAVLVLGNAFWRRSFGADPAVVGRVFEMNDRPHAVVGVLPPGLLPGEQDAYMPTSACPFRAAGDRRRLAGDPGAFRSLELVGRRAAGASLEDVREELAELAAVLRPAGSAIVPPALGATPVFELLTAAARPTLVLLWATVAAVLLLAVSNVANLALARLLRREHELAIRSSLGAGWGRLVRTQLVESGLLAVSGGLVGLLGARAALGLLVAFLERFTPRATAVAIDGRVLAFTLAISLAAALAVGLLPLLSRRRALQGALRSGGAAGAASSLGPRLRAGLVVAQVAVSTALLVAAGLFLRSLFELQAVDPGVDVERVVVAEVPLNWSLYDGAAGLAFLDRLVERLEAMPEVISVGVSNAVPLAERGIFAHDLSVEGEAVARDSLLPVVDLKLASPRYFETLGVPIVRGRAFTPGDTPSAPQVAILGAATARDRFGDADPIGRRIALHGDDWKTVVGVAGDVHFHDLDDGAGEVVYLPVHQAGYGFQVFVRTRTDPDAFAPRLKRAVHGLDPRQPVGDLSTLGERRRDALRPPRTTALLLALFAALAALVTAAGIGGVLAYSVSARTREIGVRLALGAGRRDVLRQVLGEGLGMALVGLVLGLGVALVASPALAGMLFAVAPRDPLTLAAVALTLVAVALAASGLPALKASRVEATVALREG